MNPTVYFLDKSVTFLNAGTDTAAFDIVMRDDGSISRAKVVKILESHNRAAVLCDDPDEAFRRFADGFKHVSAAGGLVRDSGGRNLMIFRRGRWDLPKGHLEPGESIEECARREVGEETGITRTEIVAPICNTYHAYDVYGVWELKCTHWFLMECADGGRTLPQHEEDIAAAEWLDEKRTAEALRGSYPTIRAVFAAVNRADGADAGSDND